MTKQEIRAQIRAQLSLYLQDREQSAQDSNRLIHILLQSNQWRSATHILLFSPLSDEIDIAPLLHHNAKHQQLYLPVVNGDQLDIHHYAPHTPLQIGAYGIQEPQSSPILTDLSHIELAVIPAIGYTATGERIGRGKGYYDKLLAKMPNCYKIGVCYDLQIVEKLPTEQHDQPMDMILTPHHSWHTSL